MMTLISNDREHPYDPDYGLARARDAAFDAVTRLWRKRRDAGMKQRDLAALMDKRESWVSRQLSGPGNWTMKVFGQLVDALDGEIEIVVHGREETEPQVTNHDAYSGYGYRPGIQQAVTAPPSTSAYVPPPQGMVSTSSGVRW
jgi:hypothetical protein